MDNAELYRQGRARMVALVHDLDPAGAATIVPASPAWTVADVMAHMAGIAADVTAGKVEGAGTDAWTDDQVASRKGTPIAELVAEWEANAAGVEAMLGAVPARAGLRVVADLVTHEHDIRGALGRGGDRDSPGVEAALQAYVGGLHARLKGKGLGPLRLVAGNEEWVVGAGDDAEPQATVRAEPFDLFRALSGRRSRSQIEDLDWEGSPSPFVDHFSQYGYPSQELVE